MEYNYILILKLKGDGSLSRDSDLTGAFATVSVLETLMSQATQMKVPRFL